MSLLYFDHAASAPRREEVLEAMAPYLHGVVGNPSGSHRAARESRRAIEEARDVVAEALGVGPGGVIFTGGGTESCYMAILGRAHYMWRDQGPGEIIAGATEHHAVLAAAEAAEVEGSAVSRLAPVDADGVIDVPALGAMLRPTTVLVSVMTANNETGTIQPVSEVANVVHRGAPFALVHTDAIAAAPWLDLRAATEGADLVSICAHKIGGPVNSGALIARGAPGLSALIDGGGQERGRRGGTVDVAAAVGLARAMQLVGAEREIAVRESTRRRDALAHRLTAIDGVELTSARVARLPGHVHVTVAGVASDELLFLLDQSGVCASAASSCSSGATSASHVLAAMGVSAERARGALRLTFGAETTDADIDALVAAFERALASLRPGD